MLLINNLVWYAKNDPQQFNEWVKHCSDMWTDPWTRYRSQKRCRALKKRGEFREKEAVVDAICAELQGNNYHNLMFLLGKAISVT